MRTKIGTPARANRAPQHFIVVKQTRKGEKVLLDINPLKELMIQFSEINSMGFIKAMMYHLAYNPAEPANLSNQELLDHYKSKVILVNALSAFFMNIRVTESKG